MKKKKKKKPSAGKLFGLYGTLVLFIAGAIAFYVTQVYADVKNDYWPTESWKTSSPEAQGMDSAKLAGLFDAANGEHLHSLLVVRNGNIVLEAYDGDVTDTTKQHVYSVTKSFVSALFGIAQSDELQGKLSIDDPISKYFPQLDEQADANKKEIRVKQLMTMTSGISWPNDNEVSSTDMIASPNWVDFILSRDMQAAPGTVFNYSNGNPHLVSALLQKSLGMTTEEYARQKLFSPLGITDVTWEKDPQGITLGAWGIRMTLRDMAKFGYLYLKNGKWDNKTIVPKDWIKDSVHQYVGENLKDGTQRGYGLFWWLRNVGDKPLANPNDEEDMFSAVGFGGQRIVVIPKENMVVVATGMNENDSFFADKLIDQYILPAIKGTKSLPPNDAGQKQLSDKIAAFKQTTDGATGL